MGEPPNKRQNTCYQTKRNKTLKTALTSHFLTEIAVVPVQNPICIQESNQER